MRMAVNQPRDGQPVGEVNRFCPGRGSDAVCFASERQHALCTNEQRAGFYTTARNDPSETREQLQCCFGGFGGHSGDYVSAPAWRRSWRSSVTFGEFSMASSTVILPELTNCAKDWFMEIIP